MSSYARGARQIEVEGDLSGSATGGSLDVEGATTAG
ncbi:hypothetical protein EV378_6077 [Pseudonocardia endophytica]|uniref:Uncharacterized protein n=1 Tax=Pseudonocardia endophytica TaxID=401976 RepID=A0A4R1HQP4_PSEEN|nr:hypothetical protein EV378_6077 [Pseudonocardia endophytica]